MFEEEIGFDALELYEEETTETTTEASIETSIETNIEVISDSIYQTATYIFKNSDHASSLREYLFKHSK